MTTLRWIGFAVGIALLIWTWVSVIGTLVVPRAITSPISRVVDGGVDALFRVATRRVVKFARRDAILAWQAPLALLARLLVWMASFLLAYGLVLLPFVPGAFRHAFIEAGSSMFTVGFAPPAGASSTVADYFAAYTGLIVVALQIGYLPTLYAAFNKRETEVTLLMARAGLPAWGPELLARTRFGIDDTDATPALVELFDTWERWSAEVAESHTTYLSLVRLRSPRHLSHWLTSLLAIMDAAALHLALAPEREPRLRARLCLRMGFVALQRIGDAMGLVIDQDPDPDQPLVLTYEEFVSAVDMLTGLGYPAQVSAEEAWPHFRGWRVNYERTALALAYAVDAPPALWSGPRRWPSEPMAPDRPTNRQAKGATKRSYP
jgi:hypothetical protein